MACILIHYIQLFTRAGGGSDMPEIIIVLSIIKQIALIFYLEHNSAL